jgi:hypothetical protein
VHPLQNRVTPFGEIVALPGRGLMMGNRGILHDEHQRIVRSSALRRWLTCVTEFRGRYRTIMAPHRYTELFFLDEATAFSAGHRPCAECRNPDYRRFRALWAAYTGRPASADAIDLQLHAERRNGREQRTHAADVAALPDGTFIGLDGAAWLVRGDALWAWSDSGYRSRRARPPSGLVDVLTPRSIVAIFRAGYAPAIHPSATNPLSFRGRERS